jgi:hypothetical protein
MVELQWQFAAGDLQSVEVLNGSSSLGSATYDDADQSWAFSWQTPLAGPQVLSLLITDAAGNTFCVRPVAIELVEAQVPPARIVSPATRRIRLPDLNDGLLLMGEAQSLLGAPLTLQWSQIDGPAGGTATFSAPTSAETAVTFDLAGAYTLQFSAGDTQGTAEAELVVLAEVIPPTAPTADLIAHYPLNTDFTNASGPAPDATSVGDAAIDQESGLDGAVLFDGIDDRVDIPSDSAINSSFSSRAISVWFKPQSEHVTGTQVIFEEGGTSRALVIYLHDGSLYAGGYIKGNAEFFASSTNFFSEDWNHVVLTTNTLESRVYLNGTLLQAGPALNLSNHNDPNALGGVNNATRLHTGDLFGGGFFSGWIDEARLYDQHLSAGDVTDLYENFLPSAPEVDAGDDTSALCTTTVDLASNASAQSGTTTAWSFTSGPEEVSLAGSTFVPAVPGSYVFRLSATLPVATAFSDLNVEAQPISYSEFLSYHHPEMTGDKALPEADWEDDGLSNELEFGMGTTLTEPTFQVVQTLGAEPPGWGFRYPVNPGVTPQPQPMITGDLTSNWDEAVHGQDGITISRNGFSADLHIPTHLYPGYIFLRLTTP